MADIRHVVVLMMENRSFDHMLGYLPGRGMDVDGVTGITNKTENGTPIQGKHLDSTRVLLRPHHEAPRVHAQINGGDMNGFALGYPNNPHIDEVMGWYDEREVNSYDRLARQYVVCDRWHSSMPGPTFPNRYFALCGTSTGIENNFRLIDHDTFFDLLPAGSWRYYSHDIALLRTVQKYTGHVGRPIEKVRKFYEACEEGTLPSVSWIDPNLTVTGVDALWSNDDHPPADIKRGQNLVARVYNYLVESPNWKNTLFIVTYDEHGGFYDHVKPPDNNHKSPLESDTFKTYGVRVPAFVISPWAPRGAPFHGQLDHTCIARTVLELFAPAKVAALSPRVTASPSLLPLLTEPTPRTDATRLEGMSVLETAIAPIRYVTEAIGAAHSIELTDMQIDVEKLKALAKAKGVPEEDL